MHQSLCFHLRWWFLDHFAFAYRLTCDAPVEATDCFLIGCDVMVDPFLVLVSLVTVMNLTCRSLWPSVSSESANIFLKILLVFEVYVS